MWHPPSCWSCPGGFSSVKIFHSDSHSSGASLTTYSVDVLHLVPACSGNAELQSNLCEVLFGLATKTVATNRKEEIEKFRGVWRDSLSVLGSVESVSARLCLLKMMTQLLPYCVL